MWYWGACVRSAAIRRGLEMLNGGSTAVCAHTITVLARAHKHGLGHLMAVFYLAWAAALERCGRQERSDAVLSIGLLAGAEPSVSLRDAQRQLILCRCRAKCHQPKCSSVSSELDEIPNDTGPAIAGSVAVAATLSVDSSGDKCSVFSYDEGMWTPKREVFYDLAMRTEYELGEYGNMLNKIEILYKMAGMYNRASSEWTKRLTILPPGFVPFDNGLFNINEPDPSKQLRPFTRDDMLTVKFDFDMPRFGGPIPPEWCYHVPDDKQPDDVASKIDEVRGLLGQILPEPECIAESFFVGKQHVEKALLSVKNTVALSPIALGHQNYETETSEEKAKALVASPPRTNEDPFRILIHPEEEGAFVVRNQAGWFIIPRVFLPTAPVREVPPKGTRLVQSASIVLPEAPLAVSAQVFAP